MFGISSNSKEEVEQASKKLHNILEINCKKYNAKLDIYRPVVSPISKIKNKYRWRIIAKCNLNNTIVNLVNTTLDEYYKLKFKNTRVIVDVNPNNLS